jgi:hypothetical protein
LPKSYVAVKDQFVRRFAQITALYDDSTNSHLRRKSSRNSGMALCCFLDAISLGEKISHLQHLSATRFNSDMLPRIQNRFRSNLPPRFRNSGCNVQPPWFLLGCRARKNASYSALVQPRTMNSGIVPSDTKASDTDATIWALKVHYPIGLIERLRQKPWYPNTLYPLQHELLIHPCFFLNVENAVVRKSELNAPKSHFSTNSTVSCPFENDKQW